MYRHLLEQCCDESPELIDKADNLGRTPLHLAAELYVSYDAELARILLEKGANPNIKDKLGRTPLHVAVISRAYEVVKLLLEHGADVNCKDESGKTPLACINIDDTSTDIRDLLIEHGAKIDLLNETEAEKEKENKNSTKKSHNICYVI